MTKYPCVVCGGPKNRRGMRCTPCRNPARDTARVQAALEAQGGPLPMGSATEPIEVVGRRMRERGLWPVDRPVPINVLESLPKPQPGRVYPGDERTREVAARWQAANSCRDAA